MVFGPAMSVFVIVYVVPAEPCLRVSRFVAVAFSLVRLPLCVGYAVLVCLWLAPPALALNGVLLDRCSEEVVSFLVRECYKPLGLLFRDVVAIHERVPPLWRGGGVELQFRDSA